MYMNNNISKLNAQGYDPNLVALFGQESWKALDAERRLNALRQLEAQTARMSGRTPLDVRVMPEKAGSGGMLGYYDHSRRSMFLHPRYLQSGGLNLGDYSAAAAIRTVLHEGRHGFQWISVAGGSDRVPQDTLLEGRDVFALDSSNIQPEEWKILAQAVREALRDYDGVLITHPADNLILPGIARKHLLQACATLGVPVEERPFDVAEMMAADEVFVSSSSAFVKPISVIDGQPVGMKDPEAIQRFVDALDAQWTAYVADHCA